MSVDEIVQAIKELTDKQKIEFINKLALAFKVKPRKIKK